MSQVSEESRLFSSSLEYTNVIAANGVNASLALSALARPRSFKTPNKATLTMNTILLHFGVTEHPTEEWTMQQMREAFPWDQAPRYVLRDRDAIYGREFAAMTRDMGMEEVLTAPRSPWQNPFAERLVGSIRRECLDHVMVWNERSLRRTLQSYFAYYQRSRTHLALGKDAPESRAVEPPEQGRVVAIPQVGGLHHRYQRRAA
jgi:putative transposase